MAPRLTALWAGRAFLVLISVRGKINAKAMVRLKGLGKLKKKIQ
jgi:hypothetical protein